MIRIISIIVLISFFFSTNAATVLAAINYSHDANGNMTSNGTNCYEYNEANQLKKIKRCSDNQIIAEYVYDYTGKRLVKKEYENGVLKQTIYSPTDEYETKKKPDGTTQNTTYYKVNDEVAAKKNPDGSINYYHNDHLGSNSVLTDQNGQVVEKTTYKPYGEVKSGGTKSKFGYTGQEKDLETGLNYYDARYYDSHIQRFIQPDTMLPDVYDPQQLNRYSYARNNPLKYTDPSGNFIVPLIIIAVRVATVIAPAIYKAATSPAVKSAATAAINTVKNVTSSAVNVGKSVASSIGNAVQTFASNASQVSSNVSKPINNQIATRGTDSQKYITNNPQTGWKAGSPINNLTSQGNDPSWSTVRQRFWKNEASSSNPSRDWNSIDIARMKSGLAPQQNGRSLELDHWPPQRSGGKYEFDILNQEQHQARELLRRQEGLY